MPHQPPLRPLLFSGAGTMLLIALLAWLTHQSPIVWKVFMGVAIVDLFLALALGRRR